MKILAFEGMFDFPLIEDQLLKPLLSESLFFEYKVAGWSEPINLQGFGWPDIVIGHSLGGARAIELADHTNTKYLITLDPRWMNNLGWLDIAFPWQGDFQSPPNIKCYNFTHWPNVVFPGYHVDGASNMSVTSTHFTLPGNPNVRSLLKTILKGWQ